MISLFARKEINIVRMYERGGGSNGDDRKELKMITSKKMYKFFIILHRRDFKNHVMIHVYGADMWER